MKYIYVPAVVLAVVSTAAYFHVKQAQVLKEPAVIAAEMVPANKTLVAADGTFIPDERGGARTLRPAVVSAVTSAAPVNQIQAPSLWQEAQPPQEELNHPAVQLASTRWIALTPEAVDALQMGDNIQLPVGNLDEPLDARVDSKKQVYGGDVSYSLAVKSGFGEEDGGFAIITRGETLTLIKIRNQGENYLARIDHSKGGGWLIYQNELGLKQDVNDEVYVSDNL